MPNTCRPIRLSGRTTYPSTSDASGYGAAALTVLIAASYPVATRAGVTGSFAPQDLILLRFGIGALIFLPYLMLQFPVIRRDLWLHGLSLTLFQGAGMAALVICGLQFAPASHASALGPGASPAWVACLGFFLFSKKPLAETVVGASLCLLGILVLTCCSAASMSTTTLAGDVMFLAASALGALYVLQLRKLGIGSLQSAAIVTVYSAVIVVPWQIGASSNTFWQASVEEIAWQVLWQGVLVGCVALIALNHAVAKLGVERSSALIALVPVITALLALLFLGEVPSSLESVAIVMISLGVTIGARSKPKRQQVADVGEGALYRSLRQARSP
jgi:drug/metabolite transporter (DMT)-like permease